MSTSYVEAKISVGLLAIVPYVPDSPSVEEVKGWDLQIRAFDSNAKGVELFHPGQPEGNEKRWKNLDGQSIQVLTDHRPRARYLYWQYCTSMLPTARRNDALKKEFKRGSWGMKAHWMKRGTYAYGIFGRDGPRI